MSTVTETEARPQVGDTVEVNAGLPRVKAVIETIRGSGVVTLRLEDRIDVRWDEHEGEWQRID